MVPLIKHEQTTDVTLPDGEEKVAMVHAMFDRIAPRYDLMNRLISLGLDTQWRKRAIGELALAPTSLIGDVGAGTADFARSLRALNYRTVGIDLSLQMLAAARGDHGPLVQADAGILPFVDGALDGIISGFALRNFADVPAIFSELARVTRPGGRLCILEVDVPKSAFLRIGHKIWFGAVVPRLGSLLSDGTAYRYLPKSVAYLPTREELITLLTTAGYSEVQRIPLFGGIAQLVLATRNGDYGIRKDPAVKAK